MRMRDGNLSRSIQQGGAVPTLDGRGADYNSCWSALPDVIRAKVEPLLAAGYSGDAELYRSSASVLGQGPCSP